MQPVEKNIKSLFKGAYEFLRPTPYALTTVLLCFITLKPMRYDAGLGVCILVLFFSYISSLRLDRNYNYMKGFVHGRISVFWLIILYIYFCFSIYGLVFLENDGLDGFPYGTVMYIVMSSVWTCPLFIQVMVLLYDFLFRSKNSESDMSRKAKAGAVLILMLNYGLWLYAFNPCIGAVDSYRMYYWAHIIGTEPMLNWHPPFYALVLSFLLKIFDSAVFIVLVQCFAYSVLVVQMVAYLMRKGMPRTMALVVYLAAGFAFNNTIQMLSLFKDTPYTISILWLTFLLVRFVYDGEKLSWSWYIEMLFAMVCTAFFRQNGIMPVGAAIVVMLVLSFVKKNYRLLAVISVTVVCFVLIKGPLYSYYKVIDFPGMKYFAMTNDLIGSYYACDDPTEEVVVMVNEITDNNPQEWYHTSYYTGYYDADTPLNDYPVSKFMYIYIKSFVEHPKAMLLEILRRNTVVWSIVKPVEEGGDCINFLEADHPEEALEYEYAYRNPNVMTGLLTELCNRLTDSSIIYVLAWRASIYVLMLVITLYFVIIVKAYKTLTVFVPVVFNILSLIIGSGWAGYRYYWPNALMSVLILLFLRTYFTKKGESLV